MDLKRSLGLRERCQPRRPTRASMVMPRARCVHAERAIDARRPGFPQPLSLFLSPVLRAAPCHPGRAPGVASELGNQLRPDGDHPNEKCDRRQRRSLFHEYLQHAYLLIRNIRRTLFLFCSDLSSVVVAQFEKCPLWLILDWCRLPKLRGGTCYATSRCDAGGRSIDAIWYAASTNSVVLGRLGWVIVRTPDTRNRSRPYP